MKNPDIYIKVSRNSIRNKIFDVTREQLEEKFSGEELEKAIALLPNEEEKEFMDIFTKDIKGLERTKRKMSVCLDAEIEDLEPDKVSYSYNNINYKIETPENSWKIAEILSTNVPNKDYLAFIELCNQGKVTINNIAIKNNIKDGFSKIGVDELSLLIKITSRFFFQTYME